MLALARLRPEREETVSAADSSGELSPDEIAELVRGAQAGDVVAFERLIAQYQGKVYTFALTCCGDREAAKDLAQDALVKVFRSIKTYRFRSSFSTWLFSIVRNTFLDGRRSQAGREKPSERPVSIHSLGRKALELDGHEPPTGAEELLLKEETRDHVRNALREVPEPFRETVFLADIQGLDQDEIATALAVATGTVKSRLNRGRNYLREVLFRRRKAEELP